MNYTKISFKLTFRNVQGYPQGMRLQSSLNAKTGLFPGLIILETNNNQLNAETKYQALNRNIFGVQFSLCG